MNITHKFVIVNAVNGGYPLDPEKDKVVTVTDKGGRLRHFIAGFERSPRLSLSEAIEICRANPDFGYITG